MPNEYSIEIHNYLTQLIQDSEQSIQSDIDPDFHRGRIEELHWIRNYLADNIDLKDFTYY